ncbi:MAG: hypothetical protein MI717_13050 [Spirochaetales bacterium]|nr:hypothetical protein [Spirochaetales bacterium]
MFLALVRPEDRPNTVHRVSEVLGAGTVVMIICGACIDAMGYALILMTPLVFMGDGLAEPIGVGSVVFLS